MGLPIEALQKFNVVAAKIVPKKSNMPIITYLAIHNGYLHATNCTLSARMQIGGDLEGLIPYDTILKILKEKPNTLDLHFGIGEQAESKPDAILNFDGQRLSLVSRPVDDFPNFPTLKDGINVGVWTPDTFKMLKTLSTFASKDVLKPGLMGVLVEQSGMSLECAATDGHRLRRYRINTEVDAKFKGLISVEAINLLSTLGENAITFYHADNHLDFFIGDMEIAVRLIDEQFPDYNVVVPEQYTGKVIFDRRAMIKTLTTAINLHATSDDGNYQVRLTPTNGQIDIKAENKYAQRKFNASVPVETNTLPDEDRAKEIGINAEYLSDILKLHNGDSVEWRLTNPLSPQIFPGENYIDLLMPIRLGE